LLNEKCKINFFNIDFISWPKPAKERVYNFIKFLESKNMIDLCSDKMLEWLEKNNFKSQDRFPILDELINKLKHQINDKEKFDILDIIINNIKIIEKEINQLNGKLREEDDENYELSVENNRLKNKLNPMNMPNIKKQMKMNIHLKYLTGVYKEYLQH
jgi:regulator of replication initiation timing